MADKAKILDIDISSIISKSSELKSELDSLKKKQAELKKEGDTSSSAYVKLEASIKKLSSEYNNNQKQLSNLAKVGGDFLTVNEKINVSLAKEINTQKEAEANVKELILLRKELNLNDKEQLKIAEQLNKKIDENNDFIKENSSQLEKQKIGIGDYASGIREALGDVGVFNGELATMKEAFEAFQGPFKILKDDFVSAASNIKNAAAETEGMTGAQKGLTIATNVGTGAMRLFGIALAAVGIGLMIAAVALLISYLRTFDPVMDRVEQVFSAVGAAVEVVTRVIFDFVRGLTDVGATIQKVGNFLKSPIKAFRELGKEMADAAKEAAALKKAQQDIEDVMRLQEVANAKASQQIKELMLQSKNRTLSEEDRLKLLEQANKIEQDNYNQRAKLADEELRLARWVITSKAGITEEDKKRLKEEGTAYAIALKDKLNVTDEEVQAIQDAEIAKIKILEESTTIREKIQNQSDALEEKRKAAEEKRIREIREAQQKATDAAIARSKAQIDLFIAEQGYRAKSLEEQFLIEQTVTAKRLALLEQEFKAGKKIKEEYEAEKLNIQNEFLQKQAELTVDFAKRQMDAEIKAIPSLVKRNEFLSELIYQEEQRRLDKIATMRANFEAQRLEQGIIDEQTYQDTITAIQEENQLAKDELAIQRKEAEKEQQQLDFENQLLLDQERFGLTLEQKIAQLNIEKEKALEIARQKGADEQKIKDFYAEKEKNLRKAVELAKIDSMGQALGLAKSLFKENTTAYKAAAIAEATIATYKNAVAAYGAAFNPVPTPASPALGAVFAGVAVATGLANIAKIAGAKFADGGILKGPSHANGGIPTPFGEMEGKEAIINKRSTEMFKPLLSAINVAGGGVAFAKGGIPDSPAVSSLMSSMGQKNPEMIDYDLLADKIGQKVGQKVGEANAQLPPNKLVIEEFNTANNNYLKIIKGADFG